MPFFARRREMSAWPAMFWDGKTLSAWIERQYEARLGVRQCQRVFRQLGFRLRKPRPMVAQADPQRQKLHKKNSRR